MDEPSAKATSIAHATQDHLQPLVDRNPRYERLSERDTDVVERWQSGVLADPDAVEALEAIEREVLALEEEADEMDISQAAFALYSGLVDDYIEFVADEPKAKAIAENIVTAIEANIDMSFEGWHRNQSVLDDIEIEIIRVLVKQHDRAELVKTEDFVTDARDYVVANLVAQEHE